MLTIAYYFLQVVICSGLMTGYYWLVLRNKRFHQYNRFYLLAITLLSWIVPLIRIQLNHHPVQEDPQLLQLLLLLANNNAQIDAGLSQNNWLWESSIIPPAVYILVATMLVVVMIRSLVRLYLLLKQYPCRTVGDVYLILTKAKGTPFSFFRYIFWNEEIDIRSEAGKQILQHELTHVRQKHSLDKLFMQLVLIAGWFNPFFWLIRKEMDMIHEFIADKKAVNNGDTAVLAQMLLTAAYPQQKFALSNPFFSPIKRRLHMLSNTRNPRFSYIRRLIVLPLLAVVITLFAFRSKEQRANATISMASVMENVAQQLAPQTVSEKSPLSNEVLKDTAIVIRDTALATTTVDPFSYIRLMPVTSVVFLDGNKVDHSVLSTIDPVTINSISIIKDGRARLYGARAGEAVVLIETRAHAAAGEVLKADTAKQSNPGKVPTITAITLPGVFSTFPDSAALNQGGYAPLVVIDGVKTSLNNLSNIKTAEIVSIDVLKNERATERYGSEGKNGVVEVTTHRAANRIMLNPATKSVDTGVKPSSAISGTKITLSNLAPVESGSISGSGTKTTLSNLAPVESGYLSAASITRFTPPQFPGGSSGWYQYLERSLNKNIVQKNGGPPGKYTVFVSMIIASDGSLSDVRAQNDPGYGTAEEAVRVVSKGPRWTPAYARGTAVGNVPYTIAVGFTYPN